MAKRNVRLETYICTNPDTPHEFRTKYAGDETACPECGEEAYYIDPELAHMSCMNWPNCDTEGCGDGSHDCGHKD